MKHSFFKFFITIAAACATMISSCNSSPSKGTVTGEEDEESSEIIAENPPTKTVVQSPPEVISDTADMMTFTVGERHHRGVIIWNMGKETLYLDRVTSSDPHVWLKVKCDSVPYKFGVSVWGYANFDEPVGNFKVKTEIYWKNYKNPTVIYFKGNCVEKE